jgi:hypothetical protein
MQMGVRHGEEDMGVMSIAMQQGLCEKSLTSCHIVEYYRIDYLRTCEYNRVEYNIHTFQLQGLGVSRIVAITFSQRLSRLGRSQLMGTNNGQKNNQYLSNVFSPTVWPHRGSSQRSFSDPKASLGSFSDHQSSKAIHFVCDPKVQKRSTLCTWAPPASGCPHWPPSD